MKDIDADEFEAAQPGALAKVAALSAADQKYEAQRVYMLHICLLRAEGTELPLYCDHPDLYRKMVGMKGNFYQFVPSSFQDEPFLEARRVALEMKTRNAPIAAAALEGLVAGAGKVPSCFLCAGTQGAKEVCGQGCFRCPCDERTTECPHGKLSTVVSGFLVLDNG
jgi:hypothetical protein